MSRAASVWAGAALLPLALYTIVYWLGDLLHGTHPKIEAEGGSLTFYLNAVAMFWPIWLGLLTIVFVAFVALRFTASRAFEESD
jgi:hypothetical protein